MPIAMEKKRFITLLLRGTLGGAVGGFVWVALGVVPSFGFPLKWKGLMFWLIIGYLYLGLPAGVIIGAFVGTMIWLINRYRRVSLGLIGRVVIGAPTGILITWMTIWWRTYGGDHVPMPWHAEFLRIIFFGAALGGVAGMIAGTQRARKGVRGADDKFGPKFQNCDQEPDST